MEGTFTVEEVLNMGGPAEAVEQIQSEELTHHQSPKV